MRDLHTELYALEENEPVPAVVACHHLYLLGLDDEHARGWRKLAGRPAGVVRAFLANMEGERPELVQHRLSEFAKEHKSERSKG